MNVSFNDRLVRLQRTLAPVYFLAPAVFLFIIFVVWPIVQSFWISLHEWSGFGPMTWVGLDNFRALFQDERFHTSFLNNIKWLALLLLSPVLGLALALFLNQNVRGIRIAKSLFFFPFVINLVVIGLIFSWFYNPKLGLLAAILRQVGLEPIPVLADENLATYGIIVAHLWKQTAYCLILYLTGLTSISKDLVEAGRIDGAAGFQMLRHVVLPQLRGATFIAVVVTIIGALRSFDLVAVMTGGGPYGSSNVLAYQMYREAIRNFNMGYGASIAVILFLLMVGFIAVFLRNVLEGEK